jgi:serine/threonine protein kinase/tetratricopeptide (TPR) repeat protein
MQELDIFAMAIAITDRAQRAAYLDQACAGDTALRQRLMALFQAHDQAGNFLENPAVGACAADGSVPATHSEAAADTPMQGTAAQKQAREASQRNLGPGPDVPGYAVRSKLGEGGMGTVWRADQTEPIRRPVALKIIKAGLDSAQVVARFEQERQALALMDHPNIAKVLDAGTTADGRPYFVMELVKGIPITKYCDQEHLTLRERLELFIAVCQAVKHAHQKGIIHRDLKPSNVLVGLYDGKAIPKVIDFGVAKATAQKLSQGTVFTEFGQVVGTFEYMSPEQAEPNNLDIDTRADIYSLGALLYQLLTGSPPFASKELRSVEFDEMRRIIREVDPPKPSTRLSSSQELPIIAGRRKLDPKKLTRLVHGDLDWIVMKCLEKDRGRRYETASALAQDLERYLADEPVLAGPPSQRYRLRKFLRRNKGPVAAVGGVMLVLILGIIGTTLGMVWATDAEAEAWDHFSNAETARSQEEHQRKIADHERKKAERARANEESERKKVEQKEAIAQQRRRQAEAVANLLESVFLDLQPYSEHKGQIDFKDRLLVRLGEVERELEKDGLEVETQAQLQNALGLAYLGLGEATKAIALHQSAWAKQKACLGADHADTLASMNNLALAYLDAGKLDLALRLFVETLEKEKTSQGPDHPSTLTTMNNLALVYQAAGKLQLALPLFIDTLEKRKTTLGLDHPDTLTSMNNLAMAHQADGKLELAVPLLLQTLEKMKANQGADFLATLAVMNNLADAYLTTGRLDLAAALFQETLEKTKARLGPDHPETLGSMHNLASAYQAAGKIDAALPIYLESLEKMKAKLGADHPITLTTMNHLAAAYHAAGKLDLALPLLVETLDKMKTKLGQDHPDTLAAMNNLADVHRDTGKLHLALQLYTETLEKRKLKLGADHPNTLSSMHNLASAYQAAGNLELALPLYQQTVDKMKIKLGPDHPNTLISMNHLATAYQVSGKINQALPLYLEALDKMKDKLGPDHPATMTCMNDLAIAYRDTRKFNLALPLFLETLEKMKAKLGPEHPDTLKTMGNLAVAYKAAGKFDLALPLYRETLEKMKAKLGSDHPDTLAAMNNLASAYQEMGKLNLALPLLIETFEKTKAKLGTDHPATVVSMNNLAVAYQDAGKFDLALPLFLQTLAKLRAKFGSQHPNTDIVAKNLLDTVRRIALGTGPSPGVRALLDLSRDLLSRNEVADALLLLRPFVTIRTQAAPNAWTTLAAQSLLGQALLAQDKHAEAQPLLVAGFFGLHLRQATIPEADRATILADAADRLVRLYQNWPTTLAPRSGHRR